MIQKTSRINVRVSDVTRGKLVEQAGPHGTISNVVRAIVEQYFIKQNATSLKQARRAGIGQ